MRTRRKSRRVVHGSRVFGQLLLPLRFLRRVDRVTQILACFEANVFRRGDGDLLVGARIAAFACFALAHGETAEAWNGAALAALACFADVADERIERGRSLLFRNASLLSDRVDDVTLTCHTSNPPVRVAKKCGRFLRFST